jgi:ATP-binding cassette subfamily B protein/subfamily B ATP-binding cassette protein MsbA
MKPDAGANPRWLLAYIRREWRALTIGSILMVARAGVLLAIPWPLKFIIDNVIFLHRLPHHMVGVLPDPVTHRMLLLNELGLMMVALGLVDSVLSYVGRRIFFDAGQRIIFHIRFDLFSHLQRLSMAFHRRKRGGELMARLTIDIKDLQDFIAAIGIDILPNVLTIVGMATVMLLFDWRFALIALLFAPILVVIARFYTGRMRHALRQVRRHEGALTSVAQEILGCVQVVQAFGREKREDDRFAEHASESLAASRRANAIQSQFGPAMNLAIAAATGALAWYGTVSVIQGRLSPGELTIFLAYLRGMATPARQIAKAGRIVGRADVALERIGEYRAEQASVADPPHARQPAGRARNVVFRDVGFSYQPDREVLDSVSFELEAGKTVALVGATGSGKSTIASLIPRFYDPSRGQVLLDGVDLRELPLSHVRRQVALVLQEPLLFQATVWENIAYGLDGASRAEAIEAARTVGVYDVIDRLPDGFDAMVSERGSSLSGGQRQCVSVARAMLCDAPIVILDEPSSSLDSRTEQHLMGALSRLAERRASLVIAHRLSTVMAADEIIVLDQGRIVQRGDHRSLLAERGAYAALWGAHRQDWGPRELALLGR